MNYFEHTNLSPSSINLYNTKVIKWISFMPEEKKDILHIILHPDEATTCLVRQLDNTNPTNLHMYYSAIVTFLNHASYLSILLHPLTLLTLKEKWYKIRDDNQIPILQKRLQNKPTALQEQKGGTKLTYADILTKRDSLTTGSIAKLLLGFYTFLPPVRADYHCVQILKGEQEANTANYIRFVNDDTVICVLTDFKTAKKYKRIENQIPAPLLHELRTSLQEQPRDYLFVNQGNKPFTRNAFTVWSKRILSKLFDTEFTLVIIRHLFLSSLDYNKLTTENLIEIGSKMGHSIQTQRDYKWNKTEAEAEVDETEDGLEMDDSQTKNVVIHVK